MKAYHILKTFPGSQHGNDHDVFLKDTVRNLSPDLARIALAEGWAEPAETRQKKIVTPEETKVVEPEETKALKDPEKKKRK